MRAQQPHSCCFSAFGSIALALLFALTLTSCKNKNSGAPDLALVGATLYASPTATPVEDAVVLVHNGKIAEIGKRGEVKIPESDTVIDCTGKAITAGFWNSHVHFTEDVWNNAASARASQLEPHMQEMLTRWGFTTVFDLGSNPMSTGGLRGRIADGDLAGPRIFMAADIFPKNGIPSYLPKNANLPQAGTPTEARALAIEDLASGADAMKLFTGSYQGENPVINMPEGVVKAAVGVAHAQGKPVFAHPQNHVGVDNALAGGVDVLAHTIPGEGQYTSEELARMKVQHTALIPTLTLWEVEAEKEHTSAAAEQRFVQAGVNELKTYFDQGGTILFGTDVGYQHRYDTTEEYLLMAKSGMTWRDILASLTKNPATFFKAGHTGEIAEGDAADLVVLSADPAADVRNFAKVDYTIRAGKVIYQK
ncbi:MAG: amidohydrolase family protein [Candidatus Korobacteraceae bacterium]